MQKDCRHCQSSLWDFITQELSASETKKIEEHLQGCPSCRQEAEKLKLLIPALREEVPLPEHFSATLHQKLSRAAEEMAAQKPIRKKLPQWGGFKTLAPALVCLGLVVGVFSSGLYDQWKNADELLTESPVQSSAPKVDPAQAERSAPIEAPVPARDSSPAPLVTNPNSAEPAPVEADSIADAPEVATAENTPAVASLEGEDGPTGLALPRQTQHITCLTLLDSQAFLDGWQEASGYDWETYLVNTDPRELLSGVTDDTMVLQLPPDVLDSLLAFEEALSITQDGLAEEKTEFLIIITEDEE